ncbi:MAG: hypothetical protein RIA09_19915 [Hoeflea sp.]|uniref:hypothetical protein n=1 Tax=Hoeflea sp. TaxID=1940281 RepID=UPI0032EF4606
MKRIVIGKNSALWRQLSSDPVIAERFHAALSHRDLATYAFMPDDEIWVLSYSRDPLENRAMIDSLGPNHSGRVIYFSTATANVCEVTRCYQYPRVKAVAAAYVAAQLASAVIVQLGFVYKTPGDLPSGRTAAISMDELAVFFRDGPGLQSGTLRLFTMVHKPHGSTPERILHRAYDVLQKWCGAIPCALRPLDVVIRAAGWKWYGYVNLSNRLWSSTTSL